MKKLLLIITIGFIANLGYSQISENNVRKIINQNNKLVEKVQNYTEEGIAFDIIEKLCIENWVPDSLDNLYKNGEGTMTLDKLDGNRFKITQDFIQTDETGNIGESISEVYFRGKPDFNEESSAAIDSFALYILQAGIKIPLIKDIYLYDDNDKLLNKISYFNFAFYGLPIGFAKSDSTNFYYDDNDFLVGEATYSLSYTDYTLDLSDSIVYTNNAKGLKTESVLYQTDDEGNFQPINKTTYHYDSQDRNIKEETYINSGSGDWILSLRSTTDYQSKLTVNLKENTFDAGDTWEPTNMDSIYFVKDVPLGFPNREVALEYVDGKWEISYLTIFSDCSGTFTHNIEESSFISRFESDDIIISSDQVINNANVTLYNTNGQVILNQKFNIVPERISTYNLLSGIYILKINSKEIKGVNKLIKF